MLAQLPSLWLTADEDRRRAGHHLDPAGVVGSRVDASRWTRRTVCTSSVARMIPTAQHGVRAGHGDAHRQDVEPAGARVLTRDGSRRADAAHPVERVRGRLDQDPQRQAVGVGLGEDRPGDRAPRGAALPRRQPAGHRDGDPCQGASAQDAARRPRHDHDRLSPADERQRQRREPPARGVGDQPKPEDPGPRARGADRRPQPAQPEPRSPFGQAPMLSDLRESGSLEQDRTS